MGKKLKKMNLREVSLTIRAGVDNLKDTDTRLPVLMGFFHNYMLKLSSALNFPLDTDVLITVIADYLNQHHGEGPTFNPSTATLEGYPLVELLKYINTLVDASSNPAQLAYFHGFTQGILNRIFRKLGVPYQFDSPF